MEFGEGAAFQEVLDRTPLSDLEICRVFLKLVDAAAIVAAGGGEQP